MTTMPDVITAPQAERHNRTKAIRENDVEG
jgi:hypothetical protein